MHACTDGQIKAVGVSVGGKRQEKGAGRGGDGERHRGRQRDKKVLMSLIRSR